MTEGSVPGADREGFVPVESLRTAARDLAHSQFLQTYPAPGLLVSPAAEAVALPEATDDTKRRSLQTLAARSSAAVRYMDRVGLLVKRPGSPFPGMISVGRAANNDVVLAVNSVSKFHGYFACRRGLWTFTDHESTNGTTLNGKRLEPGEGVQVNDGDRLRFGLEIEALFLLPESLYTRLRKA